MGTGPWRFVQPSEGHDSGMIKHLDSLEVNRDRSLGKTDDEL